MLGGDAVLALKDLNPNSQGQINTRVVNKKGGSKPNTRAMNQVASATKKPPTQGGGGQTTAAKGQRDCHTCGVPHGHVLDCPAFHTLLKEGQFLLAACTACLTTNHAITWKQRATWYATHEAACTKDFLCVEGSCQAKLREFCLHMVLCEEHIAQNQGAIDQFKSTHQKYSNIALYQLSSNLK